MDINYINKIKDEENNKIYDIISKEDGESYVDSLYVNNENFTVDGTKMYIHMLWSEANSNYDPSGPDDSSNPERITPYSDLGLENKFDTFAKYVFECASASGNRYYEIPYTKVFKCYSLKPIGDVNGEFSFIIYTPYDNMYRTVTKTITNDDFNYTLTNVGFSLPDSNLIAKIGSWESPPTIGDTLNSVKNTIGDVSTQGTLSYDVNNLKNIVGTSTASDLTLVGRVSTLERTYMRTNNNTGITLPPVPISGQDIDGCYLQINLNDDQSVQSFSWTKPSGGGGGSGGTGNYNDLNEKPQLKSGNNPAITLQGITNLKTVGNNSIIGTGNINIPTDVASVYNYNTSAEIQNAKWYFGTTNPSSVSGLNNGDVYLYIVE